MLQCCSIPSLPIFSTVQTAAETFIPIQYRIPNKTKKVFLIMQKIHKIWRIYTKKKIYTDPNHFASLVNGHLVSWTIGNQESVKIAAQCILILHRILDCSHKMIQVSIASKRFLNTFSSLAPFYENDWKNLQEWSWCSPSSKASIHTAIKNISTRISLFVSRIWLLLRSFFDLSMSLMETFDAFHLDPNTKKESVREMFMNAYQSIDYLAAHQHLLESQLIKHKKTIQEILKNLGSNYQVDTIIETVRSTIQTTKIIQSSNHKINLYFIDFFQHAGLGVLEAFGMAKLAPSYLIPQKRTITIVPYLISPIKQHNAMI